MPARAVDAMLSGDSEIRPSALPFALVVVQVQDIGQSESVEHESRMTRVVTSHESRMEITAHC